MASRIDEMRAYRFSAWRVRAAAVTRQVDVAPSRRTAAATFAGLVVALVSLAVAAVYGVVTPGPAPDWRRADAIIVEKETGARYVLFDGTLHRVLNYVSARLIIGIPAPAVITVTRRDLATVDRGTPLGIAGAPDSIPGSADLLSGTWTACSDGTVVIGPAAGGHPLAGRAVLVVAPDRTEYLIWQGRRDRIRDPGIALAAFGWTDVVPVPVAAPLVAVLPPGPDLVTSMIDGRDARPVLDRTPHTICALVAGEDADVVVDAERVADDVADPLAGSPADYARVVVPPGHGALVRAGTGPVCLVTDEGMAYPIDDAEALASLGYADVTPVVVPAAIVALLPPGARLSRARARTAIHR